MPSRTREARPSPYSLAAAAVLLVLSGCAGDGGPSFPEAYTLTGGEMPPGLTTTLPEFDEEDAAAWEAEWGGPPQNPLRVPKEKYGGELLFLGIYEPADLWLEFIGYQNPTQGQEADFVIMAGKWADQRAADKARELIVQDFGKGQCPGSGGTGPRFYFLQDEEVVVLATTNDFESYSSEESAMLLRVARALTSKTLSLNEFLQSCS